MSQRQVAQLCGWEGGVRGVCSLSLHPSPLLSPALNEWHQAARVGVGIYCHINEDALMNEQGWEWDTPLFFQILFTINDNNFECYLYCKTFLSLHFLCRTPLLIPAVLPVGNLAEVTWEEHSGRLKGLSHWRTGVNLPSSSISSQLPGASSLLRVRRFCGASSIPISGGCELTLSRGAAQGAPCSQKSVLSR